MRFLPLLFVLAACGGSLAPPDPGPTKPVIGAGFVGIEVTHGTTAITVAIDRSVAAVDALFAPASCRTERQHSTSMVITGAAISAGTLEIDDLRETTLEPATDGSYPDPGASSTTDLQPGGEVTVSGTGGDIPAFAASLDAPPTLEIDAPDPRSAPSMLDGTKDLGVRWKTQPGSTVRVALYAVDHVLACDFPSAAGGGTLPGAQIAELGASDADLVVTVLRSTSITSGAVSIELRAMLDALGPGTQPYLYAFTLQ